MCVYRNIEVYAGYDVMYVFNYIRIYICLDIYRYLYLYIVEVMYVCRELYNCVYFFLYIRINTGVDTCKVVLCSYRYLYVYIYFYVLYFYTCKYLCVRVYICKYAILFILFVVLRVFFFFGRDYFRVVGKRWCYFI